MRKNPFRNIYDSKKFKDILKHKNIPEFPFIVDIELTNRCNLKCKMCARNIMTRKTGFMLEETFDRVLEECTEYNIPIRFIRWGEPFLHPRILTFSDKVKDAGIPLHITTNGLLLKEQHIHHLIDIGLDSIIFSMQGATKREYNKIRGGKYQLLSNNIKKLVELRGENDKPFIHITCTVSDYEKNKNIKKFKGYWSNIVDLVTIGRTNWSRINNSSGEYANCKEPWQKLSVDWDGKVTCCCGDYDNLLTIGNINKESLWNIWNYNLMLDGIRALLSNNMNRSLTLCKNCYLAYEGL